MTKPISEDSKSATAVAEQPVDAEKTEGNELVRRWSTEKPKNPITDEDRKLARAWDGSRNIG